MVAESEPVYRAAPEDAVEVAKRREAFINAMMVGDDGDAQAPLEYAVTKAVDEQRYTLGPLYAPDRKDAHGEYVDPDTLQKAVWDYVRQSSEGGRRLNLQHGDLGEITVGEWVEVMAWPYEHTIKVSTAGGEERELSMPAGTVYLGAVWDADAWPLVKAGKVGGWSLGGKAVRVKEGVLADMTYMGDKTPATKAAEGEADRMAVIRAAAEAVNEQHRNEVAALRKQGEDSRGLIERLIDTVKDASTRELPQTHIHVPIPVTVNPAEVKVDVQPADVKVNLDVVE